MSSVAPYSHKRGQLVSVPFCQWIVNGVRPGTFALPILSPIFDPPDKLDTYLGSIRSGAAFTAEVKNIRSCFRFGIESGDDSPRLFASEELPPELRAVRVVENEAIRRHCAAAAYSFSEWK